MGLQVNVYECEGLRTHGYEFLCPHVVVYYGKDVFMNNRFYHFSRQTCSTFIHSSVHTPLLLLSMIIIIILSNHSLIHSGVHITLQGLNQYSQSIDGESFTTRDIRTAPYRWSENYRFGDSALGISELAGLRVIVEQMNGVPLCEGVIPLNVICDGVKEKGVLKHRVQLRTSSGTQNCVGKENDMSIIDSLTFHPSND